jgi:hypothetical protein
MKTRLLLLAALGAALILTMSLVFAQSLGDFARAERAKKAKEIKKSVRVFTNDTLPRRPPGEGPTAASSMSEAPPIESPPASTASETPGGDKQKTQEYWQGQFKSARQKLADDEGQQRLAEDELSLLQIQQARELSPDTQSQLEAQVKSKTAEVEAKRAGTAKSRKALEDLEKEFKESGAPADWSKTE